MRHVMLPAAAAILPRVFEILGKAGVKRVHVFGVILPKLGYGSWTNPAYKVAPVLESCKVLDEHGEKASTCTPETFCRGLERCRHVRLTGDYLAHFSEREPDLVRPLEVTQCCQRGIAISPKAE